MSTSKQKILFIDIKSLNPHLLYNLYFRCKALNLANILSATTAGVDLVEGPEWLMLYSLQVS